MEINRTLARYSTQMFLYPGIETLPPSWVIIKFRTVVKYSRVPEAHSVQSRYSLNKDERLFVTVIEENTRLARQIKLQQANDVTIIHPT